MVWRVNPRTWKVDEEPQHILSGHNDEVTCVAVNSELDVVISGSKVRELSFPILMQYQTIYNVLLQDGSCILNNLRRGLYVRSFYHPNGAPISLVAVSNLLHVVFYSKEDSVIHQCHANHSGSKVITTNARETLNCMIISKDSEYLIAAGTNKTVFIYRLHK